jgi:hypothetical protein
MLQKSIVQNSNYLRHKWDIDIIMEFAQRVTAHGSAV